MYEVICVIYVRRDVKYICCVIKYFFISCAAGNRRREFVIFESEVCGFFINDDHSAIQTVTVIKII